MRIRHYLGFTCALAWALLAALAGPGMAAPSFFGYTGLVEIPTADALDGETYNLAAFALNVEEGADSNVYAANMGLEEGLEVGFARLKPEHARGETLLHAKHRFQRETAHHPAIAAGVVDLTDEVNTTAYVVMSKSLLARYETRYGDVALPRIHVGVGGGQFDGFFLGLSTALGDRLLLMAEYDTDELNFGARLAVGDYTRIHGAILGADDVGFGISFNKVF